MRHMLSLPLRERTQLVPHLIERDWISEWSFCLRYALPSNVEFLASGTDS